MTIITPLHDHPERIRIAFRAETAADAVGLAKAWAAERPLRIKTVCSVRPYDAHRGSWAVELAVRWLA